MKVLLVLQQATKSPCLLDQRKELITLELHVGGWDDGDEGAKFQVAHPHEVVASEALFSCEEN